MYLLLSRPRHLAAYLLVWSLVGCLVAAILAAQGGLGWELALGIAVPAAFVDAFVCLSAWYVARALPLAGTTTPRLMVTAITAAAASSAIWLLLIRGWSALLAARWPVYVAGLTSAAHASLFALGFLLYLLALAVSYGLLVFEAAQETQRRVLEGQVLAREAELRSLRAQLDPHFLFNSLHSISALTASDPAGARRMCLLLSDLLRESLQLGAEAHIPLARELGLAERFLGIERVRFGSRLAVEVDQGDAGGCFIPPLLLQPLVENAVTHGVAHCLDGGVVRIAATRTGAWVRVTVDNPCDPDRPRRAGAGVGLANVRARLRALHGSDATVSVREEAGRWCVELTFPAMGERV